jgi:hypothetical protein
VISVTFQMRSRTLRTGVSNAPVTGETGDNP